MTWSRHGLLGIGLHFMLQNAIVTSLYPHSRSNYTLGSSVILLYASIPAAPLSVHGLLT